MAQRPCLLVSVSVWFAVFGFGTAFARPMLNYSLTPWVLCPAPCPVDDPGTSRLVVQPSPVPGNNGLVFKLKLAGLKKNGVPASVPNVRMYFFMYDDSLNCEEHHSEVFAIVNGRASITATGGTVTPPVPDEPGHLFFACAVGVVDPSDNAILVGGLQRE